MLEGDIIEIAAQLMTLRSAEQARLRRISKYLRGKHDPVYTPRGASTEYRWLARRCHINFLPLIVGVISQQLHVDGYRPTGATALETSTSDNSDPTWDAFRANRMLSRQHGIHRSVAKYGAAYVTVLPGSLGDTEMPVLKPLSPKKMTALYEDDVDDEWPVVSIEENLILDKSAPGKARRVVTIMDDTNRYILVGRADRAELEWPDSDDSALNGRPAISEHGMGVCPVVRFLYEADLDGEVDCSGEVEPLISIQDGVNFTTFNLMLAEQFAAYRQRYVSGMAATDEEGRAAKPFEPGVDRVWSSDSPDTRFGEFDVTPLGPYIDAREASIRHMSTLSQIPPYHLLGQVANLSAEALAAARDGLDRKVEELQATLTDSWRNVFRLTSKAVKDNDGWEDLTGVVKWRDTSARSFAATVDALGKAAQMLGVPVTELWERIPGATADDVESWKRAAEEQGAQDELDKVWQMALTGGAMTANPAAGSPYQMGNVGIAAVGAKPPVPAAGAPAPGPMMAKPTAMPPRKPPVPPRGG